MILLFLRPAHDWSLAGGFLVKTVVQGHPGDLVQLNVVDDLAGAGAAVAFFNQPDGFDEVLLCICIPVLGAVPLLFHLWRASRGY